MGNSLNCMGESGAKAGGHPYGYQAAQDGSYFAYKEGKWYACAPDSLMAPRVSAKGLASEELCPAQTLIQMLKQAAAAKGDQIAMKIERPIPSVPAEAPPPPALKDDEWTAWTWAQYADEIKIAAKGFIKLGFQPFDSVNIWGFNSPEWFMGSIAASLAGGKVAGLYPTDTPDTAAFKVVHSGGSILLVEERKSIEKLKKALADREGGAKRLKAIVAWGFDPSQDETVDVHGAGKVPLVSWKELLEMGRQEDDAEVEKRSEAVKPGHCAALIYTSGTTGEPKAVMISHDNIIFESFCLAQMLYETVGMAREPKQERIVSYLPLSHVAGFMVDVCSPMVMTATKPGWVTAYFARNYDLKAGTIKDRLVVARPTMFLGVPLVWEKIADKIRAIGAANKGFKKTVGDAAKARALAKSKDMQLGGKQSTPIGHTMAIKLLSKVKEGIGLDQCKFGFTGAAPIRVDTLEYFGSLGLQINEVYGMSECTGACTVSVPQMHAWGSCGFEMPGVEVKAFIVDPADLNKKRECKRASDLQTLDEECMGELCFRGRNIMMGYLANPDLGAEHVKDIEKKTADTIDAEGWLHSGDKGMVTYDGMVKITGRYKELIIGEGGENIAPVPIEDHVKKECDGICEVMMFGDKRKYNVALVTLKAVGANGEVPGTDMLDAGAKRVNPDVATISAAMKDNKWIETVEAAIVSANNNGKVCPNNAFKIQKFTILPMNFSEEGGELTPTKKLKRAMVAKLYAETIEKIYATEGVYVPYA